MQGPAEIWPLNVTLDPRCPVHAPGGVFQAALAGGPCEGERAGTNNQVQRRELGWRCPWSSQDILENQEEGQACPCLLCSPSRPC